MHGSPAQARDIGFDGSGIMKLHEAADPASNRELGKIKCNSFQCLQSKLALGFRDGMKQVRDVCVQDSDTDEDQISATRYIASREALTPVRPNRGHKWGQRMPSPFETPQASTDVEREEEEEEEEMEGAESLIGASSRASSEFDPDGNPVSPCDLLNLASRAEK